VRATLWNELIETSKKPSVFYKKTLKSMKQGMGGKTSFITFVECIEGTKKLARRGRYTSREVKRNKNEKAFLLNRNPVEKQVIIDSSTTDNRGYHKNCGKLTKILLP
jgi:hypothetical protein